VTRLRRLGALGLIVLALLGGCKRTHYDNKGRPVPDRSITCRDGKAVKDTGPSACKDHRGRPEVPR
jgi:hypothetical protein